MKNIFVSGGAGFIGSHLVRRLLKNSKTKRVTVYDNFSSGKMGYLQDVKDDKRLAIIKGDIKEIKRLTQAMKGFDVVFHLASNPDISKAIKFPDVDFWEGTYLTQNIIEAMRINGVKQIFYTSGSGVYGECGLKSCPEDHGPLLPISTYAASKLAGEALICSYCHMFDMRGFAFRFANVVGPRQTHGVAYDFINRLRQDPSALKILGDGTQSKSYIHVQDVLNAIFLVAQKSKEKYDCFNVATGDYITVKEIADMVVQELGLKALRYDFTGGDRGWKGDVPVVRFNLKKIRKLGWRPQMRSMAAMRDAIKAMVKGN
ncbi:MAG: NAD-dependent epimerase/dehydratase family protein [Candidatus Omnitrophica bacterium]|nr:NAD-dependent epimerase/dehydratase family protein [Candidatus Omnitrophota bacterium]